MIRNLLVFQDANGQLIGCGRMQDCTVYLLLRRVMCCCSATTAVFF